MDFRVCNALKIKPSQALLRNTSFCFLGEIGDVGAADVKTREAMASMTEEELRTLVQLDGDPWE